MKSMSARRAQQRERLALRGLRGFSAPFSEVPFGHRFVARYAPTEKSYGWPKNCLSSPLKRGARHVKRSDSHSILSSIGNRAIEYHRHFFKRHFFERMLDRTQRPTA